MSRPSAGQSRQSHKGVNNNSHSRSTTSRVKSPIAVAGTQSKQKQNTSMLSGFPGQNQSHIQQGHNFNQQPQMWPNPMMYQQQPYQFTNPLYMCPPMIPTQSSFPPAPMQPNMNIPFGSFGTTFQSPPPNTRPPTTYHTSPQSSVSDTLDYGERRICYDPHLSPEVHVLYLTRAIISFTQWLDERNYYLYYFVSQM